MQFETKPAPIGTGRIDPQEVITALGPDRVANAFSDLGVEWSDRKPYANRNGWKECHAIDREDKEASAAVNVLSGYYTDRKPGKKATHLFQFAMDQRPEKFPRWIDAARHYAELAGLSPGKVAAGKKGEIKEAEFDFQDASGKAVYRVFRKRMANGKKRFSQHAILPNGGVKIGEGAMAGVDPLPFGLPELLRSREVLYIVEGEGKVNRLWSVGRAATSAHGGCQSFKQTWSKFKPEWFAGRSCVLLPDCSNDGRAYMDLVAGWLRSAGAASVKVLDLPDLATDQDVIQWLDQGGTVSDLDRMAREAPEWVGRDAGDDSAEEADSVSNSEGSEGFEGDFHWEDPVLSTFPPAEPFPLDVLPEPLAKLATEVARSVGCSPDFPAMVMLFVASVAIGRSSAISLKEGWSESPVLYVALVGDPGAAKSPPITMLCRVLWDIAREYHERWKEEKRRHRATDPDGVPPTLRRVSVDDSTVEAMIVLLSENPRGVGMVKDELSAFFAGHNQYRAGGKGTDRQFYLSNWSGSPVSVDRKSNPDKAPIIVHRPFLGILGPLTTEMVGEMREGKNRDDGMLDRFLMVMPVKVKVRWTREGVPGDLLTEWGQVIRNLFGRDMVREEDGQERPFFLPMTEEAEREWQQWFDHHNKESEGSDFPTHLIGSWAKFRQYCARLSHVLEMLHWAADPMDDMVPHSVRSESIRRGIALVEYLKVHSRRVRLLLRGASEDNPDARAILRWVSRSGRSEFSERDAKLNFKGRFAGDARPLAEALAWLERNHCLRRKPAETGTVGRPRSAVYVVNPQIAHEGLQNLQNLQNSVFSGVSGDDSLGFEGYGGVSEGNDFEA